MSGLLTLKIAPRGSIVVRDGRPFEPTPGARAATLSWPLPGTVAGMARTLIGNDLGFDWKGDGPNRARGITFHGPLPLARRPEGDWAVYLPAPRDALVPRNTKDVHPLRPMEGLATGAGCDLPHSALRPLHIPVSEKADSSAAYWPLAAVVSWLGRKDTDVIPMPKHWLGEMPRDTRTHVAMDRAKRAALEGALFTTEALAFHDTPNGDEPARAMLCRVGAPAGWVPKNILTYLGGERRLVHLESMGYELWPAALERSGALGKMLVGATRLRLYLATPALFARGWCPDWLDDDLIGTPPGVAGLRLCLTAAAIGRRTPVSGWSLEVKEGRGGAKAARFMVPAGSVYFFEVVDGDPGDAIKSLWLTPISDDAQDRTDGYGLALPGIW